MIGKNGPSKGLNKAIYTVNQKNWLPTIQPFIRRTIRQVLKILQKIQSSPILFKTYERALNQNLLQTGINHVFF